MQLKINSQDSNLERQFKKGEIAYLDELESSNLIELKYENASIGERGLDILEIGLKLVEFGAITAFYNLTKDFYDRHKNASVIIKGENYEISMKGLSLEEVKKAVNELRKIEENE